MGGSLSADTRGIVTWGNNDVGQLGLGAGAKGGAPKPTIVKLPPGSKLAAIGPKQCVALCATGGKEAVGPWLWGKIGASDPALLPYKLSWERASIVQISVADGCVGAVTSSGDLYTWGKGSYGRLGIDAETDRLSPSLVDIIRGVVFVSIGTTVAAAVTENGRLYAWGFPENGQLGLGPVHSAKKRSNQKIPALVEKLEDVPMHQVSCGMFHTLGLARDGRVYAWGKSDEGQCGLGDKVLRWTPAIISGFDAAVVSINASASHSVCLTEIGSIYTWGQGRYGELGLGAVKDTLRPIKADIPPAVQVHCSLHHTTAILESGEVVYCGGNAKKNVDVFTPLKLPAKVTFTRYLSGDDFFAAEVGPTPLRPTLAPTVIIAPLEQASASPLSLDKLIGSEDQSSSAAAATTNTAAAVVDQKSESVKKSKEEEEEEEEEEGAEDASLLRKEQSAEQESPGVQHGHGANYTQLREEESTPVHEEISAPAKEDPSTAVHEEKSVPAQEEEEAAQHHEEEKAEETHKEEHKEEEHIVKSEEKSAPPPPATADDDDDLL